MEQPMTEPQPPDEIIICRDVHKWFGDFHVLDGVSATVKRGEVVVVFGPSGSGKSTFIRTINRLETHQRGTIIVDGIEMTDDLRNIEAIRRETGMVFQQFNLFPHLTVMQNITLAPMWVRKRKRKEAEQTALELLERVGIPEQALKYPGQLSGGQQQRVAIAEMIKEVLEVMQELAHTGITMVVVTHEMGFAREVADHMLFFDRGQIVEQGTPEQIFTRPQHERTRQFLSQIL
jgi:general L-amino acid transport system ATP-binding protein